VKEKKIYLVILVSTTEIENNKNKKADNLIHDPKTKLIFWMWSSFYFNIYL